jgi:hypothetical protein
MNCTRVCLLSVCPCCIPLLSSLCLSLVCFVFGDILSGEYLGDSTCIARVSACCLSVHVVCLTCLLYVFHLFVSLTFFRVITLER